MLAAVLEDELFTTSGAFFFFVNHAIGHIFLQSAGDAILPSVDAFFLYIQILYQFNHILDGHAMTQDARNQLGMYSLSNERDKPCIITS